MADRIYVYIDGESHFIRSEKAWQNIHGPDVCLDRAVVGLLSQAERDAIWNRGYDAGSIRQQDLSQSGCR